MKCSSWACACACVVAADKENVSRICKTNTINIDSTSIMLCWESKYNYLKRSDFNLIATLNRLFEMNNPRILDCLLCQLFQIESNKQIFYNKKISKVESEQYKTVIVTPQPQFICMKKNFCGCWMLTSQKLNSLDLFHWIGFWNKNNYFFCQFSIFEELKSEISIWISYFHLL